MILDFYIMATFVLLINFKSMKNNDYHNLVLQNLPESYRVWFDEDKKFLEKNITKDSSVLYVGCGDGREINYLLDITNNIVGIDHDEDAINRCKENFSGYKNLKFIFADAESLPFEDNSFDFVISMGVFMNLGEKRITALKEMKRVTKENGRIILDSFSEKSLEERLKMYKYSNAPIKEITKNTVIFSEELGDNTSSQFNREELVDIFKEVDIKIEEIKEVSIVYLCLLKK